MGLDPLRFRKYKRYLDYCRHRDFKLMAHLARPKPPARLFGKPDADEFAEQVQFRGKEGPNGEITGSYELDPIFKVRLHQCEMRMTKLLPPHPKEVEIQGQISHNHLIAELKSLESKYPEPCIDLETQGSGANGSSKSPSTNGSKTSVSPGTPLELTQNNGTESQGLSATEAVKVSSSQALGQSTLERLKTPE